MKPSQPSPSQPSPGEKVPPEMLEWARQTFDKEEFIKQVREIDETGGLSLESFIAEVESKARGK